MHSVIHLGFIPLEGGRMMDSVKQRILDYVSANQPAKVDLIYKEVGISRNRYYEEAKELRFMGRLRGVPGIGVFPGEKAF